MEKENQLTTIEISASNFVEYVASERRKSKTFGFAFGVAAVVLYPKVKKFVKSKIENKSIEVEKDEIG